MKDSIGGTTQQNLGNWTEKKAKLKSKYPNLTDSDLQYEEGKKEEMLTKVQQKLGKTKSEVEEIIAQL